MFFDYLKRIGFESLILQNWTKISVKSTYLLWKRQTPLNGTNVICLKGQNVTADKTARVIGNEGCHLVLNKTWSDGDRTRSLLSMGPDSELILNKNSCGGYVFDVYSGSKIYINKDATLSFSGKGYMNHNISLSCFDKISIGEDVVISEGVTIRDSDNHSILGSKKPSTAPIEIGNHVWIGLNATILKV